MNPLFLAHLLGDFIFQPYSLVKFKERSNMGIATHALIHFALLCILWWPSHGLLFFGYMGVALIHGIIDRAKITLQQRGMTFGLSFFADQVLHFFTLMCLMTIFMDLGDSPWSAFWHAPIGRTLAVIYTLCALVSALYNIAYKQKATLSSRDLLNRVIAILASFALFTLVPLLFA